MEFTYAWSIETIKPADIKKEKISVWYLRTLYLFIYLFILVLKNIVFSMLKIIKLILKCCVR